jgi:hypothetical protein
MTYQQACAELHRAGIANAQGLPGMASACQALASAHAISPTLLFDGAVRAGLTSSGDLLRYVKSHADWYNLQFLEEQP